MSGVLGFFHTDVSAQTRQELQARLALPALPTVQPPAPPAPPPVHTYSIFPGITLISPNAFAADGWTVWAGLAYQSRTRFTNEDDGAVYVGVGLGDARKYVGLSITAASLSTVRHGWFDRVGVGAQLSRMLGANSAIGIGAQNFAMRHRDESDDKKVSLYGVGTHVFAFRDNPNDSFAFLTATLGVGNGHFRQQADVFEDNNTAAVFAALSLSVVRELALVADWTGQDLALGVSLAPFPTFPLVISPAAFDITQSAGNGTRFGVAASIGYRFNKGAIQF